ncbi:S-locus-specific glycoprotein BS29-2-like [Curcuma longa]|uniref:S-locus-specific glycoprotein BS29-2-like n=1 Tax=Curcuma longa TaxID=136217 RepID=UPI003D9E2290
MAKAKMQFFLFQLLEIIAATALVVLGQSSSGDTMIQNSSLVNGQTLKSTGDLFQLGFFSVDDSSAKGYLGIWYYNLTPHEGTVVWIANRNESVNASMASFNLTSEGNLILFEEDKIVWSTGTRSTGLNSAHLQLLDSGNLVLNDSNSILWQSFEHWNSDTHIAGTKYGFDSRTNTSWPQVSWKNSTDPSSGDYIQMIRELHIPDSFTFKGSAKYRRGGLWNGNEFVGLPSMSSSQVESSVRFTFVSNENDTYLMINYTASPTPVLLRSVLCANGTFQSWFLDRGGDGAWQLLWSIPDDDCDMYNRCGRNSVCIWNYYAVNCECLDGFVKIVENGSEAGCQREKPLNCSSNNQFSKVQNVKVPDTENATSRGNMSLDGCKNLCLNDCSCAAYAVIGQSYGCITWTSDLLDLRTFGYGGTDLYVRLAGELDQPSCHMLKNIRSIVCESIKSGHPYSRYGTGLEMHEIRTRLRVRMGPKTETESEAKIGSEAEMKLETEMDPEIERKFETKMESEDETSETEMERETKMGPETKMDTEAQMRPETEMEFETKMEFEIKMKFNQI